MLSPVEGRAMRGDAEYAGGGTVLEAGPSWTKLEDT